MYENEKKSLKTSFVQYFIYYILIKAVGVSRNFWDFKPTSGRLVYVLLDVRLLF